MWSEKLRTAQMRFKVGEKDMEIKHIKLCSGFFFLSFFIFPNESQCSYISGVNIF